MSYYIVAVPEEQEVNSNQIILLINESNSKQQHISLDPFKTGIYIDLYDSYACTYQTDRADILSTEINRMIQYMRTFGAKIIFNSQQNSESDYISAKSIELIENYDFIEQTAPLFKDICVFDRKNVNPAQTEGYIHHNLLYSKEYDYFSKSLKSVVKIAKHLKLETIFIAGVRINLWLPALFQMLKSVKITPIYIYDFSDVAFDWESQHNVIETHKHANRNFTSWMLQRNYFVVNHFEFYNQKQIGTKYGQNIIFDGNIKARYFQHFYK